MGLRSLCVFSRVPENCCWLPQKGRWSFPQRHVPPLLLQDTADQEHWLLGHQLVLVVRGFGL